MRKNTILIVEDEGIVATYIQATLERLGYDVVATVATGEEAIRQAHDTRPDLVLMDIRLQGSIDGVEAACQIRDDLDIPVIYLTAYADAATIERAKMTEPFGYILKPFVERELHTMVEIALHKHRLEKQLQEREQWLAATLRSMGDGVIATNSVGRVRFMNRVAEELTGWPQASAAGRSLEELFIIWDEITAEQVETSVEQLLWQEEETSKHWLLETREGRKIPIESNASAIRGRKEADAGIVLTIRDITTRRHAEEMLHKLSNVVEKTADLVFITNREGIIEYVNPAFEQLTGYSREEALDHTPRIVNSGWHSPDFFTRLWETILSGEVFSGVMVNRRKNGELYYEEKTITPIKGASGVITNFVSTGKDVTEKRRLEQSILNAAETEQQRIGRELHDGLGQILTGIGCLMADLERDLLENERAESEKAARLGELVDQALRETRLIARGLTKDCISQNGLFTALRGLADQVHDMHRISCVVTGSETVDLDNPATSLHLYRIAQEAVNNAIKHGRATEIILDLSLHDGTLILTVQDNGTGLDDATEHTPGIGLQTMAYRADIIGGSLRIDPVAAGGVSVTCTCPTMHSVYEPHELLDFTG